MLFRLLLLHSLEVMSIIHFAQTSLTSFFRSHVDDSSYSTQNEMSLFLSISFLSIILLTSSSLLFFTMSLIILLSILKWSLLIAVIFFLISLRFIVRKLSSTSHIFTSFFFILWFQFNIIMLRAVLLKQYLIILKFIFLDHSVSRDSVEKYLWLITLI